MILKTLFSIDSVKFGIFPMTYTLILKIMHCTSRKILKRESGSIAFLSGFIAGFLSMLTKDDQRRGGWTVFLLARAVDCIYRSITGRSKTDEKD